MYLSQLKSGGVVVREGETARLIPAVTVFELAQNAVAAGATLADVIPAGGEAVDLVQLAAKGALDVPVRHPEPARMYLCGTGLTHLGSASTRNAMHGAGGDVASETDSMRMFKMGLEGGKPAAGEAGVQPEWFYKGPGTEAVAPGDPLTSPGFALDGGEEPEIAAFYLNGPDGTPHRIGFTLANEFSDHVTEKVNYLFLAHSKLRPASFGPELLVGDLPRNIEGRSRILRGDQVIFDAPFVSGEDNMSHTIANLEHHHFKYAPFRRAGDLHVHMFGTATLSFGAGVQTQAGDVFEISAPQFGLPLINPLAIDAPVAPTRIRAL
ncbi:Fumarylacetoacetate (FAA) hydrolase family protein [Aquimixticola soesokkakensis]|uniref:Fumarylacetoacetate (FAA) hydrolase family protein n=1 Tax=Aquimixticola soesokkakensis TaxID=1519096 RepID=A0A1Y5TB79_9RHOB|nr:AraD1 family protein [Aquimixticola soesokkakensis]SLN60081.1 Fumarylacetoacetate (FAA) hydrolase family protein [Aquimixticola soesokkakensis]